MTPVRSPADRCPGMRPSGSSMIKRARRVSDLRRCGTKWPGAPPRPRSFAKAAARPKTARHAGEIKPAWQVLPLSQKVLFRQFDAAMAQDVIGRRDVKKELRHAEGQQQRLAGKLPGRAIAKRKD